MSRFVVTGCAGFIGSHLADALLERGDEVIGVDTFTDYYPPALKQANLAVARDHLSFELHALDLAEARVAHVLDGSDGVFHLAAEPGVRGSWGSSFDIYVRNNVVAAQRLFEQAAAADVKVVSASSSSIYGEASSFPTSEDIAPLPVSPYGVTKLACEHLAGAYGRAAGLRVVNMRYFTVYGPRQRPDMAFAKILQALLDGSEFDIYGTGRQSRDFTYVADAVTATLAAMDRAPDGGVYNVGGGAEAALDDVIRSFEELSGLKLATRRRKHAAGDVSRTAADTTRIRESLGWAPKTSLREGLQAHFAWAAGEARANGRGPNARGAASVRGSERAAR